VAPLTWFHFALTFDGVWVTFFLDGVGVTRRAGTPTMTDTEFRVGARVYAGAEGYLDGQMAELRIWGRALSPEEMEAVYEL
jgi:hypothetical protein